MSSLWDSAGSLLLVSDINIINDLSNAQLRSNCQLCKKIFLCIVTHSLIRTLSDMSGNRFIVRIVGIAALEHQNLILEYTLQNLKISFN